MEHMDHIINSTNKYVKPEARLFHNELTPLELPYFSEALISLEDVLNFLYSDLGCKRKKFIKLIYQFLQQNDIINIRLSKEKSTNEIDRKFASKFTTTEPEQINNDDTITHINTKKDLKVKIIEKLLYSIKNSLRSESGQLKFDKFHLSSEELGIDLMFLLIELSAKCNQLFQMREVVSHLLESADDNLVSTIKEYNSFKKLSTYFKKINPDNFQPKPMEPKEKESNNQDDISFDQDEIIFDQDFDHFKLAKCRFADLFIAHESFEKMSLNETNFCNLTGFLVVEPFVCNDVPILSTSKLGSSLDALIVEYSNETDEPIDSFI
ncbi:hypothetical protein BLOT_012013 [Blomia tropicalis]|nr:hypothetical protein BLOT_012013 [Blomia tropicalis]